MKYRSKLFFAFILVLVLNAGTGYWAFCAEQKKIEDRNSTLDNLDMLIDALQLIRHHYVDIDKVSPEKLLQGAIEGMTSKLDPYSVFLPPQDMEILQEETEGKFGGVGISVHMKDGILTVISTVRDTPAYKAGILSGDQILEIDGQKLQGRTLDEIVRQLRGEPGTKVTVSVHRDKVKDLLKFDLVRAEIPIYSVSGVQLLPGTDIGYFRISQFMEPTAGEVKKALKELLEKEARSVIIDLRGNPGGLLNSAVEICSFFLPENRPVVSVEGRNPKADHVEKSRGGFKVPETIPLVLMINGGSASAAEIMSGCLRDYKRAVLVGEKSFGKGSVQNVSALKNGYAIKLTIAKYYTPSRRVIHNHGIQPDVKIPLTREDYLKLLKAGEEERMALDVQLNEACKVLKDSRGIGHYFNSEAAAAPESADKTAAKAVPDAAEKKPQQK